MKIYVNEKPKSCLDCVLCQEDDLGYWCGDKDCYISDKNVDNRRLLDCPLHNLTDHDKEVIRRVINKIKWKIRKQVCQMKNDELCYPQNVVRWKDVIATLKQVENSERRESADETNCD